KSLKELFHDNKEARALELESELRFMDLGSMSIFEYFKRIKVISDLLANIDSPIEEKTLVMKAINGLDEKFKHVTSIIRHRTKRPSLLEARTMLLVEESHMNRKNKNSVTRENTSSPTVLMAGTSPNRGQSGPDRSNGRGSDETFSPVLDVKNAFLHGHLTETVYMHQPHGFTDAVHPDYDPVNTEKKLGPNGSPVTDPTLYRSLAGALRYLTFTRPDLLYAVQQLCIYMHDPREPHFQAMKCVLRYLDAPLLVASLMAIVCSSETTYCHETTDSNSETASSKSVTESSLTSATKDVHAIKYKMSKAKARCMTYFRSLNSHLQVLSKEDLKGTRIEHGFKRAFMSLFDQDADTFTSTMLLNVDHLQKQLDKAEFHEDGSMTAFWGVYDQFQKFIDSQVTLDYDNQMTEKYFV
nr:myb-like protein P [Tanacetum cinerariifolium]